MADDAVMVTGLGVVCALGVNARDSWTNLLKGENGAAPVSVFDVSGCRCQQAAEVRADWLECESGKGRKLSRASGLAIPAAREALASAGLSSTEKNSIALSVSTTAGAMQWGEDFLRGLISDHHGGLLRRIARQQPQQQLL